jgi:hypothetical protein
MTTYTKSLSTDFGGNINLSNLHNEIVAETGIVPVLNGVSQTGDDIEITFVTGLSGGELTLLNTVISNHNSIVILPTILHETVQMKLDNINTTSYKRMGTYLYDGTIHNGINAIKAQCYMDSGITSFDIRIYDSTNNQVIAEHNCTSTTQMICDYGTISNVPTNFAVLEFQAKRNGGTTSKKVYLDYAVVYIA